MSVFSEPWQILDDPGLGQLQDDQLGRDAYHGFSARPDLWPPGSHAAIRSRRECLLGLGADLAGAREALATARGKGLADPGTAEALILAGQLHFTSWSGS